MDKDTLVLFHGSCTDGFCSAWIANKFYGDKAEYKAVNYGENLPDVKGKEVIILDFSYKRDILIKMLDDCKLMILLDHHKTAKSELQPFIINNREEKLYLKFDEQESGASLTWKYFYPTDLTPKIVEYVKDRDLWQWKLPDSKAISAALASYPFDFKVWDKLEDQIQFNDSRNGLIREGEAILRYQQQVVDSACKNATEIELDGYKVLSLNTTTMISEIGEQLCKDRLFSATYFIRSDGKKIWSLRSRPNSKDGTCFDVSELAKKHGGGGHKQAAGFQE